LLEHNCEGAKLTLLKFTELLKEKLSKYDNEKLEFLNTIDSSLRGKYLYLIKDLYTSLL